MSKSAHASHEIPLTARELEVARLVAEGRTNGEIAGRLSISFTTAKWHVSQVLAKLEVERRDEVADRLSALTKQAPQRRWQWALAGASFLKGLGVAATAVPVVALSVAGIVVLPRGGDDSKLQATVITTPTATTSPVPAVSLPNNGAGPGSAPPAGLRPAPQPHTCDWQGAQGRINDGPLDHRGCDFSGQVMSSVALNMAFLDEADLGGTEFRMSTLGRASLNNANLRGARFVQSVLTSASFDGADLTGAIFTNSPVGGTTFKGATCPDGSSADGHGGTCLGTPGLRNQPTDYSFQRFAALEGQPAPAFQGTDLLTGRQLSPQALAGRAVVLWWFAEWCVPAERCDGMAGTVASAAALRPDVLIIGISLDAQADTARAFAGQLGFEMALISDADQEIMAAYHVRAPGLAVVIAPDGRVAATISALEQPPGLNGILAQLD